jgi:isochorismate synthase
LNILQQIKTSLHHNLPFVVYKKADENIISAFLQHNNQLFTTKDYAESGFVFAPFNTNEPSVLIPIKESEFLQEEIDFAIEIGEKKNYSLEDTSKQNHVDLVKRGINEINKGTFKKVVLSRKEEIVLHQIDVIEIFKKLVNVYPKAFVYLWYHPKVGMWLGATPEILVKISENEFETMSLAGTQVDKGEENVLWGAKELEEQQMVTDYLLEKLQPICKTVEANEVETVKAGSLLHLKTIVKGVFSKDKSELIKTLHPTPAVCGYPKEEAQNFILNNENYPREFYTGFLGELNFKREEEVKFSNLFVNLRCMQIKQNIAQIYIGGGITKDSVPEKEWEETKAKSLTMKNVL